MRLTLESLTEFQRELVVCEAVLAVVQYHLGQPKAKTLMTQDPGIIPEEIRLAESSGLISNTATGFRLTDLGRRTLTLKMTTQLENITQRLLMLSQLDY